MANIIKDRNEKVLEAALSLARVEGYQWITREAVSKLSGLSAGTVNNAYGNMVGLKRAVLKEAMRLCEISCDDPELVRIVAQGIANGSPVMVNLPDHVKDAVAKLAVAA